MGTKVVSFKADKDLITQIERYAYKHKISRGEAIRIAIQKLIDEEFGNKKEI